MERATDLMLTNVGLKRLQALCETCRPLSELESALMLLARGAPAGFDGAHRRVLLERKWVEAAPPALLPEDVQLRYWRSPLEHVSRINFEVTNRCNFACRHCRNEGVALATEPEMTRLVDAARLFLALGIRRFDFIGGEVSRFGNGWLALTNEITRMDREEPWPEPLAVTVFTNGWWLEAKRFEAAGETYEDQDDYLRALKEQGVTHVLFSIDGPEVLHDDWRGHTGLYQRVLAGIPRVAAAGIAPRLSLVMRSGEPLDYLLPLAEAIYGEGSDNLLRLRDDPFNHFSNFIDVGRGTQFREGLTALEDLDPAWLRCKAFFRPSPTLRIMASGEIGVCPLMLGDEAYGSIHDRPLVEILNGLQETPLYALHASGVIARYLGRIDRAHFGERFDHVCAVRVAANRLALGELRRVVCEAHGESVVTDVDRLHLSP